MARFDVQDRQEQRSPVPLYEMRVFSARPAADRYEIWQMPCPATPQVKRPFRIGSLAGRNLELVQHRILRTLAQQKIRLRGPQNRPKTCHPVPERLAVTLGLMFRALAPLRNRDSIRIVAEGIEDMEREEASYWLGMSLHRRHPRRVLAGLRMWLTEPRERPKSDHSQKAALPAVKDQS